MKIIKERKLVGSHVSILELCEQVSDWPHLFPGLYYYIHKKNFWTTQKLVCIMQELDSSKITMIYTRADLGWFSRTVAKNGAQSG